MHERCAELGSEVSQYIKVRGKPKTVKFNKKHKPCECRCHAKERRK